MQLNILRAGRVAGERVCGFAPCCETGRCRERMVPFALGAGGGFYVIAV